MHYYTLSPPAGLACPSLMFSRCRQQQPPGIAQPDQFQEGSGPPGLSSTENHNCTVDRSATLPSPQHSIHRPLHINHLHAPPPIPHPPRVYNGIGWGPPAHNSPYTAPHHENISLEPERYVTHLFATNHPDIMNPANPPNPPIPNRPHTKQTPASNRTYPTRQNPSPLQLVDFLHFLQTFSPIWRTYS